VASEAPLATLLITESCGGCAASPLLPLLFFLEVVLETDDTEEELTLSMDCLLRGLLWGGLAVPPEASDKFAELLKSYPIEPSKDDEDVVELPEEEEEEKGNIPTDLRAFCHGEQFALNLSGLGMEPYILSMVRLHVLTVRAFGSTGRSSTLEHFLLPLEGLDGGEGWRGGSEGDD
jgi:hypothetical protein